MTEYRDDRSPLQRIVDGELPTTRSARRVLLKHAALATFFSARYFRPHHLLPGANEHLQRMEDIQ